MDGQTLSQQRVFPVFHKSTLPISITILIHSSPLFLEKEKESELDKKLIIFLDDKYSEDLKNIIPRKLRKMRNKIAHGDFIAFEKLVEEYACEIMDDYFYFDYLEYSRKNWVILHICCELEEVVRKIVNMLLYFIFSEKIYKVLNL